MRISYALLVCVLVSCKTVQAPGTNLSASEAALPEMTIDGPFKELIYNRHEDIFDVEDFSFKASPRKVAITFKGETFDATLRLRGGVSFCGSFPQLKLKLPKTKTIDGMREFKVITHGAHTLDPLVPVKAPNCADSLYTENNLRELHAGEIQVYDLASKLLRTHLKNVPISLKYRDLANKIEISEKAYLIESADDAAKRYALKKAAFSLESSRHAFRSPTDDDFLSVLEVLSADSVRKEYERLSRVTPPLSQEDIGRKIQVFREGLFTNEGLQNEARAKRNEFFKTLQKEQIAILKRFDPQSLADTLLFETMIVHTDWNLFGVTDHDDPLKNIEVFENGEGKFFVAPYDFDSTGWTLESDTVTSESYKQSFDRLKAALAPEFEDVVRKALREFGSAYLVRAERLQMSGSLSSHHQKKMDLFIPALKTFLTEI